MMMIAQYSASHLVESEYEKKKSDIHLCFGFATRQSIITVMT